MKASNTESVAGFILVRNQAVFWQHTTVGQACIKGISAVGDICRIPHEFSLPLVHSCHSQGCFYSTWMNKKAVLRLNTAKLSVLHWSAMLLCRTLKESKTSVQMSRENNRFEMGFIKCVDNIVLMESQHQWRLVPWFSCIERPVTVMPQTSLNHIPVRTKQKEDWLMSHNIAVWVVP